MNEDHTVPSHRESSVGAVIWATCGTLVIAALVMAGLFLGRAPGFSDLQVASPVSASSLATEQLHLTIVTNAGPQHDWPAYEPASFSLPANQDVTITVTNLDGATPLPSSLRSFTKVKGVASAGMTVVPINVSHPTIAKGAARVLHALNASVVSHTFSLPELGINVPIAAGSRTSFTVRFTRPGAYQWECFDPCGGGDSGTLAPMGRIGYMAGTVTVTAS